MGEQQRLRRLGQLRPWELGSSAERELLLAQERLHELLTVTDLTVGGMPVTAYAVAVHDVLMYATEGAGDGAAIERVALEVLAVLCSSPVRPLEARAEAFEGLDPEETGSEAAVACCAALGRLRVVRGEPVPDGWLAALAGVGAQTVRVYVYRTTGGALRRPEGHPRAVTAESARAFLRDRGVEL